MDGRLVVDDVGCSVGIDFTRGGDVRDPLALMLITGWWKSGCCCGRRRRWTLVGPAVGCCVGGLAGTMSGLDILYHQEMASVFALS
jgi:hypothetical protein